VPPRAEGRIEAAVGVVADEREVRGAAEGAGLHRAGDEDLAVGRDGDAGGRGIAARVGEHAARAQGLGRLGSPGREPSTVFSGLCAFASAITFGFVSVVRFEPEMDLGYWLWLSSTGLLSAAGLCKLLPVRNSPAT